jgi:hypothetical protein
VTLPKWRETLLTIVFLLLGYAVAIILVVILSSSQVQQIRYRYMAKHDPARYSQCIICGNSYPHKKMTPARSLWVCSEENETTNCVGLHRWQDILDRAEAGEWAISESKRIWQEEEEIRATIKYLEKIYPPDTKITREQAIKEMESMNKNQ